MKNKKSGKKGTFLIVTGLLLIAAALAFVGWNIWQDRSAGESSEAVLSGLMSRIPGGENYVEDAGEAAETGTAADEAADLSTGLNAALTTETSGGVAGRWVFVPYGNEKVDGILGETAGKWVFLPYESLKGAETAGETAEGTDGVWVFLPYAAGGIPQEAGAQTGQWILIGRSTVDAARHTFGEMPKHKAVVTYPDYLLNPEMDMPEETIDGNKYIGMLELPTLGLKLPVMSGWSYPKLRIAPCRYAGSAYLDNMVICGHNYDRHFGRLKTMHAGDRVKFADVDGNVFNYKVVELETLKPRAVQQMKEGEWDLTLFTCTIGGATRVTVRCEKI